MSEFLWDLLLFVTQQQGVREDEDTSETSVMEAYLDVLFHLQAYNQEEGDI
jgi:hypothetical protein